jgi:hypothetical protein
VLAFGHAPLWAWLWMGAAWIVGNLLGWLLIRRENERRRYYG